MENYVQKKIDDIGNTFYYDANNELHRTDGPAIECCNGTKSWWVNGIRHRIDGPAIEYPNGHKEWWVDGLRHRTDGPAIERADGSKAYYINDKQLTEIEFNSHNYKS